MISPSSTDEVESCVGGKKPTQRGSTAQGAHKKRAKNEKCMYCKPERSLWQAVHDSRILLFSALLSVSLGFFSAESLDRQTTAV